MYYSANWQLLEERIDDDNVANPGVDRHMQYVWGPRYIDDLICRRQDGDVDGDYLGASDNYWYHCTDAQFSTVAIIDDLADVVERIEYDAYGLARHHQPGDLDGDGDNDGNDYNILAANWGFFGPGDFDRSGVVDVLDLLWRLNRQKTALPWGELTNTWNGGANYPSDNIVGWDGYLMTGFDSMYAVRYRHYEIGTGRWVERDPAGHVNGMSLFQYVGSQPLKYTDPFGLSKSPPLPGTGLLELLEEISRLNKLNWASKEGERLNSLLDQERRTCKLLGGMPIRVNEIILCACNPCEAAKIAGQQSDLFYGDYKEWNNLWPASKWFGSNPANWGTGTGKLFLRSQLFTKWASREAKRLSQNH